MVIPRSDAKIAFADHIAVGAFLRATNLDWTLVRAAAPPKKTSHVYQPKQPRADYVGCQLGGSRIRATPVLSEK
jgi:hypothetical protein